MESELKCPICRRLYSSPVLLPCMHSVCLACAVSVQAPAQHFHATNSTNEPGGEAGSMKDLSSHMTDLDLQDVDKVSLISEADSGVVCNSRPNSYAGTPSIGNLAVFTMHGSAVYGLVCPACKRILYLDDQGAQGLPKNRALENIVDKFGENKNFVPQCQLCEGDLAKEATMVCEQCEVYYCEACLESCHPLRGPLAKHNLVDSGEGRSLLRNKRRAQELKCSDHNEESLSMYCMLCKCVVCFVCAQDGRHVNHDVQALGMMSKTQKTELSQLLQQLSEKARAGTEFIQRLRCMSDRVQDNSETFEARVVSQCDALVAAIRERQQQLIAQVRDERSHKQQTFREQLSHATSRLHSTTALIQFSIEILKESDPATFLQVSSSVLGRVSALHREFHKEMEFEPRASPDFEMSLDDESVLQTVNSMGFLQMKAPQPPQIIPEECVAEHNTVTIVWKPQRHSSHVDGYILELDDGNGGDYREVYCGAESICAVEGLHFDSLYNARVKGFNHAGDSKYSESVCLQTAEVAWFTLDPNSAHPDVIFTNDNLSVTTHSFDDRTVLATVGLSKGIHYWEVTVDRHENNKDPAFGVVRLDAAKDRMIGKDDKGWGMYVDSNRSWFMHAGAHSSRTEGGITQASVVGVLLDLNQHTLSFYINGEPHGNVAFTGLTGVFFPAITINRNVQLSLQTGLEPPIDSDAEEE